MRRFGVRANAIAPFAWTRMTQSIPMGDDPVSRQRIASLTATQPEDIAPLAVYLSSDASAAVNGQVFAVRGAEVVLFSLPAPRRSLHRAGGWTAAALGGVIAGMTADFVPLQVTSDVFGYPPLV